MIDRDTEWFKGWLEKQKHYSPRPYEQLAKVLKESGDDDKSQKILFLSMKRERQLSNFSIWQLILEHTIGYGFKLNLILRYVLIVTGFGWLLLLIRKQGPAKQVCFSKCFKENHARRESFRGIVDSFFYSLDMLLPIIRIDKWDSVELTGLVRYYFFLHKLIGYLLAVVLVAWLAGVIHKY